jgi:tripartite motif-containing protein 23
VTIEEITESFGLFKLCCNRSWHIQACDANSGYGLLDGLEWLSRQMVAAGAPDLLET